MDEREKRIIGLFFDELTENGLDMKQDFFEKIFEATLYKVKNKPASQKFVPQVKEIYVSKGHKSPYLVMTGTEVHDPQTGEVFITYYEVKPTYNIKLEDPRLFSFRKNGDVQFLPINSFCSMFDEIKGREEIENLIPDNEKDVAEEVGVL